MSVSVSYYMRQYYTKNSYAASDGTRAGRTPRTLADADMEALKTSLKDFKKYDYEDGDGVEMTKKIQAFAQTYNHLLSSAQDLDSDTLDRYVSKLKKLTKEHASQLADIGVTVQGSGELKIDKDILNATSRSKVKKLFGKDAAYTEDLSASVRRLGKIISGKNLGVMPAQGKEAGAAQQDTAGDAMQTEQLVADAQLYAKLAQSLDGTKINYSV